MSTPEIEVRTEFREVRSKTLKVPMTPCYRWDDFTNCQDCVFDYRNHPFNTKKDLCNIVSDDDDYMSGSVRRAWKSEL